MADGQELGHGAETAFDAAERVALLRERTERALAGEAIGEMPFDALRTVAAEGGIPHLYVRDHLDGFDLDAAGWRPESEDDLIRYCYHVAGAVGCMMAVVMGIAPEDRQTLERASDLGIAFQLANIARDIGDDAAVGRCYLPAEWLAELAIPAGALMEPEHRGALAVLARRLAERAETYEVSAREGARKLPFRARWAVLTAAGIYGDIAREVAGRGPRAWDRRVVTSGWSKAGWVARSLIASRG